jgi:hypothetical protein
MTIGDMTFEACWHKHFPNTPPVRWIVRNTHEDRWVRLHALPKSKQYADTEQEAAEILRRANALGDELFGDGADCWFVGVNFYDGAIGAAPWPGLVYAFNAHDKVDDQVWAIFATRVQWRVGAFDAVVHKVANEELESPVFWIAVESGIVFAPYDGGFDMIFPSVAQAVAFRDFQLTWRPRDPDPGSW